MKLFIIFIVCLLVFTTITDAQRRRKNKGKNCHLKEVDKCFEKVEETTNKEESVNLIKNSKGLDQICKASLEGVDCIAKYMKKCGTPLQNELYRFLVESFNKSVERFCNSQSLRNEFLKHSPCLHDKVLVTPEYKDQCVQPMLASLDKTKDNDSPDDRLDAACCSYNRWDDCRSKMLEKNCGATANEAIQRTFNKAFGGFTDGLCPVELFKFKEAACTKHYAKKGAKSKGKISDNPVTRYIATYFAFLF